MSAWSHKNLKLSLEAQGASQCMQTQDLASEGDLGSVSSVGFRRKKNAVVRKESVDTQECESCQLNDMAFHMATRTRQS